MLLQIETTSQLLSVAPNLKNYFSTYAIDIIWEIINTKTLDAQSGASSNVPIAGIMSRFEELSITEYIRTVLTEQVAKRLTSAELDERENIKSQVMNRFDSIEEFIDFINYAQDDYHVYACNDKLLIYYEK